MVPLPILRVLVLPTKLLSLFGLTSLPSRRLLSGYACAYPLGVLGIIGATIAIRFITGTKLADEEEELREAGG